MNIDIEIPIEDRLHSIREGRVERKRSKINILRAENKMEHLSVANRIEKYRPKFFGANEKMFDNRTDAHNSHRT